MVGLWSSKTHMQQFAWWEFDNWPLVLHGGPMQIVGKMAMAIDMQSKKKKTSSSLKLNASLNVSIIMNLGRSVNTHSHPLTTK